MEIIIPWPEDIERLLPLFRERIIQRPALVTSGVFHEGHPGAALAPRLKGPFDLVWKSGSLAQGEAEDPLGRRDGGVIDGPGKEVDVVGQTLHWSRFGLC